MSMETDSKRRRVTIACNRCRGQKLRCDGVQPTCGRCAVKARTCEYPKKFVRANVSEEYVRHLEKSLSIMQNKTIIRPTDSMQDVQHPTETQVTQPAVEASVETKHSEVKPNVEKHFTERKSSAFSFMCLVEAALGCGEQESPDSSGDDTGGLVNLPPLSGLYAAVDWVPISTIKGWQLPPVSVAEGYIRKYFKCVYPLCPFMHEPSFTATYEVIREANMATSSDSASMLKSRWNIPNIEPVFASSRFCPPDRTGYQDLSEEDKRDTTRDASTFYVIVNYVLALGCLYSSTRVDNHDIPVAQLLYERGRRSMSEISQKYGEASTLIRLQALLLQTQYLQATHQRESCLQVIGPVVRIAQELGLYSEHNIRTRKYMAERELCRRLWYGCLVMDRSISISFGRPMLISRSFHVSLPELHENEYTTERSVLEPSQINKPSIMAFFEQSVKLYGILADVLRDLYFDNYESPMPHGNHKNDLLFKILEYDYRIGNFKEGLPQYLKFNDLHKLNVEDPIHRQEAVLHIRYLHVLIMLYRPVLIPSPGLIEAVKIRTELRISLSDKISAVCVGAAIKMINILSDVSDTHILPASWLMGFYVYTAAVVILAAMILQNSQDIGVNSALLENKWKKSLELLRCFQKQGNYVDKGIVPLEGVYKKMVAGDACLNDVSSLQFLPGNSNEIWGFDVDMLSRVVSNEH